MKKIILLLICLSLMSTFVTANDEHHVTTSAVASNKTTMPLDVYKSESCSCCEAWVDHLNVGGFKTSVQVSKDMNQIKTKYGISANYQSCHTAVSKEGFIFEGHIPSKVIEKFLQNPPKNSLGLAVPDMPVGSPGMEDGDKFTPYDVLLLKKDGSSEVYTRVSTIDQFK